jgi:hypothetical protein
MVEPTEEEEKVELMENEEGQKNMTEGELPNDEEDDLKEYPNPLK